MFIFFVFAHSLSSFKDLLRFPVAVPYVGSRDLLVVITGRSDLLGLRGLDLYASHILPGMIFPL